jgi:hypothetical protein
MLRQCSSNFHDHPVPLEYRPSAEPVLPARAMKLMLPLRPSANLANRCRTRATGWCSTSAVTNTTDSTAPNRTIPVATFRRRRVGVGAMRHIIVGPAHRSKEQPAGSMMPEFAIGVLTSSSLVSVSSKCTSHLLVRLITCSLHARSKRCQPPIAAPSRAFASEQLICGQVGG